MQDMPHNAHRGTHPNPPPPHFQHEERRIQSKNLNTRRHTKIEQYIQARTRNSEILPMGPPNAFGAINRTQHWEALYKKDVPIGNIIHIRQWTQNTKSCAKYRGEYGPVTQNNVGVFQGAALSAPMCIIYLDDVMEDYDALNRNSKLPTRQSARRDPNARHQHIMGKVQKQEQETRDRQYNIYRTNAQNV